MAGGQDKMFNSQKYVFLNALILTVFIFSTGIALGYWFEGLRSAEVDNLYSRAELNLLDIKTLSEAFKLDFNCSNALEENLNFGDKIYNEAKVLERFENAERLTESLRNSHYKYDLMRVMFFLNTLNLKERCGSSFHTVLYLYQYENPSIDTKNKQAVFSNMLMRLKEKRGSSIVLIPIAGDINFSSINLIKREYDITQLPVIIIDEKIKLTETKTSEEIDSMIGA